MLYARQVRRRVDAYESRYGNFIGGEWVPPIGGEYFENPTPVTGQPFTEVPRSTEADIDKALDAAHGAASQWGKTAAAERANILNKIADRIESNLESLALAEAWDNGKPIRETLNADLPLAVDHFRYFAGAIRAQEGFAVPDRRRHGGLSLPRTARRGQPDHPWNFPILMATWKLAPALAAATPSCSSRPNRPRVDPLPDEPHRRPASRRRDSTSSTGSGSRQVSRWRRRTGSPRSRSPGRPPPDG
jgi:acyl-CoA reductase-like NAD-dependent aldehyde dehydrogenase